MTPVMTPSEEAPTRLLYREVMTGSGSARYEANAPFKVELVRLPKSAPRGIRVSLELGMEDAGVWAHIVELDVAAEGENAADAFRAVLAAAREWLSYVRDEQPELAPELGDQERYVPLLDAPVFSWFKSFRFAE